jgi:hypothetical protein
MVLVRQTVAAGSMHEAPDFRTVDNLLQFGVSELFFCETKTFVALSAQVHEEGSQR